MVNIELTDGKEPVLLRYEDHNWELCWKKNVRDPQTKEQVEQWKPLKWFMNPYQALVALANMQLGNSSATTLKELLDNLKQLKSDLLATYHITH